MKLRIQSLLLIMTLAAATFSCKDDDDKPGNAYIFDGTKKAIKYASFSDDTEEDGGGYTFEFLSTTPEQTTEDSPYESLGIQIPKELMGAKFQLTEEQLYNWGWWFSFENEELEADYTGFGAEGAMEDVKSGTMTAIKKGDGKFTVEADIVFEDGKTFKLYYSGKWVDLSETDEPARVSTHLKTSNSPNQ